jgi:hypothetical protein
MPRTRSVQRLVDKIIQQFDDASQHSNVQAWQPLKRSLLDIVALHLDSAADLSLSAASAQTLARCLILDTPHGGGNPAESVLLMHRSATCALASKACLALMMHARFGAAFHTPGAFDALLDALAAAGAAWTAMHEAGAQPAQLLSHAVTSLLINLGLMLSLLTDAPAPQLPLLHVFTRPLVVTAILQTELAIQRAAAGAQIREDLVDPFILLIRAATELQDRTGGKVPDRSELPQGPGDGPAKWVELLAEALPARLSTLAPAPARSVPAGWDSDSNWLRWNAARAARAIVVYGSCADLAACTPSISAALGRMVADSSASGDTRVQALVVADRLLSQRLYFRSVMADLGGAAFARCLLQLIKEETGGGGSGGGSGGAGSTGSSSGRVRAAASAQQPTASPDPGMASELRQHALMVLATIAVGEMASRSHSTIAAQPESAETLAAALRACIGSFNALRQERSTGAASRLSGALRDVALLCQIIYAVAMSGRSVEQLDWVALMLDLPVPRMLQQLLDGGALAGDDRHHSAAGLALFALAYWRMVLDDEELVKTAVHPSLVQEPAPPPAAAAAAEETALMIGCALRHLAASGHEGMIKALNVSSIHPTALEFLAPGPGMMTAAAEAALEGGVGSGIAMLLLYRMGTLVEQLPMPAYAPAGVTDHNKSNHIAHTPPNRAAAYQAALAPLRALARHADPRISGEAGAALAAMEQRVSVGGGAGPSPLFCASCGTTAAEGVKLKRCIGCRARWFCSPECQRADWKSPNGHKAASKAAQAARAAAPAAGGS